MFLFLYSMFCFDRRTNGTNSISSRAIRYEFVEQMFHLRSKYGMNTFNIHSWDTQLDRARRLAYYCVLTPYPPQTQSNVSYSTDAGLMHCLFITYDLRKSVRSIVLCMPKTIKRTGLHCVYVSVHKTCTKRLRCIDVAYCAYDCI